MSMAGFRLLPTSMRMSDPEGRSEKNAVFIGHTRHTRTKWRFTAGKIYTKWRFTAGKIYPN